MCLPTEGVDRTFIVPCIFSFTPSDNAEQPPRGHIGGRDKNSIHDRARHAVLHNRARNRIRMQTSAVKRVAPRLLRSFALDDR